MRIQRWTAWMGLALGALWMGCGGSSGSNHPPPPPPVVITIDATGVHPKFITVGPGAEVTFVNNDWVIHEMASNPHPQNTDCPELNVGPIGPGISATTMMGVTAKTCGFHDHRNPALIAFQGSVTVNVTFTDVNGGY